MPINRGTHISAVIEEVKFLNPKQILDVGCGWGLMGVIFRAFTDIRMAEIDPKRYYEGGWETTIDGVEINPAYRNSLWAAVYDFVWDQDIFDGADKLDLYDLIYMGDVIEHIEKEKGKVLIMKLLKKCDTLLVATPSPAPEQSEILNNPHERHLSSWDESDFAEFTNSEVVGHFDGILLVRIKK